MSLLEIKHLSVVFNSVEMHKFQAVKDVNLTLRKGEILGIVGESGSGKSVTALSILGLLPYPKAEHTPESSIIFQNQELIGLNNQQFQQIRGNKIAFIFQEPMSSLNPLHKIGKQIAESLKLHQNLSKKDIEKRTLELLQAVKIPNPQEKINSYPFELSGGQRQRVMIAMAIANNPQILIADEPTTALDVTIQAQIIKLIKDLSKEYNFTTIYITHDLGVVANVADYVAVMYAGQIIEYGTVEDIFYDSKHPYTWGLLSSLPQLGLKGEELFAIRGTPPSLFEEVKGDAFAPRSNYSMKIDFEKEPPIFKVSESHWAKTWLLDPRAPKVEPPAVIKTLHQRMLDMTKKGGVYGER